MSKTPFLVVAGLFLAAALVVARGNRMRGFPDGHLTRFEGCMEPALALTPFALGLCAVSLVAAAVLPRYRVAAGGLAILSGLGVLVHLAWAAGMTCRGLENGWGG